MKKNNDLLNDDFFNNINGYQLDLNQRKIIVDKTKNILVVAGAGSGKTLTMVGKIKYLIEKKMLIIKIFYVYLLPMKQLIV